MIFSGVCTALVTPFKKNKKIDYLSLKQILDKQIKANINAVLILGSTGESSTISDKEREEFIKFTKKHLPKSIKLIVGTGSNNTQKVIQLTNQAKNLGADACLIVTPYYNRCTQNGIYLHYKKITQNTNIPIIVYNVPSRTGVNIMPKTMQKICQLKNICGLKEANSDISHILEMFNNINIPIYSGNDNLNYIFLKLKSKGFISVTSNAYPKSIIQLYKNGELKLHDKFYAFNNLMFIEPNPIPIKYVLYKLKLIKNSLRLPLTTLQKKHKKYIDEQLIKLQE